MRRSILLTGVLLTSSALIGSGSPPRAPAPATQGEPTDGSIAKSPPAPTIEKWNDHYGGTVTAVGTDSITIVSPGWKEIRCANDRSPHDVVTKVVPPQPPKTFPVSANLAAGGYCNFRGASHSYRLSDVRVGDGVSIEYMRVDGVDICQRICISGRPGGRVPIAPGERLDLPLTQYQWHRRCNAEQDWKERGIPLPDEYHPGGKLPGRAPMPHDPSKPREIEPGVPMIPAAQP